MLKISENTPIFQICKVIRLGIIFLNSLLSFKLNNFVLQIGKTPAMKALKEKNQPAQIAHSQLSAQ